MAVSSKTVAVGSDIVCFTEASALAIAFILPSFANDEFYHQLLPTCFHSFHHGTLDLLIIF